MERSRVQSLSSWQVVALSVLTLCLILVTVLTVPWLFSEPYDGTEQHTIIHESSSTFGETVAEHDISVDDPTPVADLSPVAQQIVRNAVDERGEQAASQYSATFCRAEVPVCNEYEQRPSEFTYGSVSADELHDVVTVDDEIYLVETGTTTDAATSWGISPRILFFVGFVPFVGVLAIASVAARNTQPQLVVALAAIGLVLTALGVLTPFLGMYLNAPLEQLGAVVLLSAWGISIIALMSLLSWEQFEVSLPFGL